MAKKPKILVVEDDQFLRKIYITKLTQENFDVLTAIDGEEALAAPKKETPDIILLDLILPKIDGFEVLRELKNNPETRNIPVIILSNLGQQSDIERGRKLGAIDYLVKSQFSINEVVNKIKSGLKHRTKQIETQKNEIKKEDTQKMEKMEKLKNELAEIQNKIKEMEN
jgi:DNA-binding response OmpR family regulator